MSEIIIDEEFRFLLPMLDKVTFESLEKSLLMYGARDPLVLWNDILIDGYNRFKICSNHNIPFKTVSMEFSSRDEVTIWMIENQVARRNLTPIQLTFFRGMHYKAEKRIVTNEAGRNQHSEEVVGQNDHQPRNQTTAERLGEKYNVSPRTIRRDAQAAEAISAIGRVSPEAKMEILSGAAGITRKQLNELLAGSEDDVIATASSIENGTFEGRGSVATASNQSVEGDDGVPGDSSLNGLQQSELPIERMTDDFLSELQKLAGNSSADLKKALRVSIDRLEGFYSRM